MSSKKKVLVTGANGFLGTALTQALVAAGHTVYGLVRSTSNTNGLKGTGCQFLIGDVTNKESLNIAFKDIDTVFHLAGVVAYKKKDRPLMEQVNIEGTRNVIEASKYNQVQKLVYVSSIVAIGAGFSDNEILNEEAHYNLQKYNWGYYETKRIAENIVLQACRKNEIDAVILNPSTIYGIADAKKGSRSVQVKVAQGKFKFYTPGGVSVVSLENTIEGIISGWEKGKKCERYILSGENITIKKLFQLIAEEAGVRAPYILMPRWILTLLGYAGDFMTFLGLKTSLSSENAQISCLFHWYDCSKAQKELGFKSSSAKNAIHTSVQWMKDNQII